MSAPDPMSLTADGRRLLRQAVIGFVTSSVATPLLAFLAGLLLMLFLINGLNVAISYVGRDFMSSIEHRDMPNFVRNAWLYVGVFAASTVAAVIYRYLEERLALMWRERQTRRLVDRYLSARSYLRLDEEGVLPNPDQRISEDVKSFTTTSLSFLLMTLNAAITIVAFSGVLWSISPWLFVVAVFYSIFGSLCTFYLGRPLIAFNVAQLDREADFRSELIQVRENTRSIALMHLEDRVHQRLIRRLEHLVVNARRIISVNRNLGFFTNSYNYLIQIIPAILVAPLFIQGQVEFGVIAQSAMAFTYLMGAFSLAVTQFASISTYAAVISRLGRLIQALDRAQQPCASVELVEREGNLRFEHLHLRRTDGAALVTDLTLEIKPGVRTLITADVGRAKVALLSATAGLHFDGSGRVLRPDSDRTLFVPEQPYLVRGSLRELLHTRQGHALPGDPEVLELLRWIGLERLVRDAGGLDTSRDWNRIAGAGDQVRIMLARVLLARPIYAILDRLNALQDPAAVQRLFARMRALNITYVVLGAVDDPREAYDAQLHIDASGHWSWNQPPLPPPPSP